MTDRPIWLVEDNPDDIALMLHALKSNNTPNPVVIAEDGEQALQHLQRAEIDPHCTPPALILLDLNLPKRSGLEVLRQIRRNERTRLVPVVVLTSSLERQDRLSAYECGANSYIRKPVDFEEFVQVTGELSRYWLSLNQPALDA